MSAQPECKRCGSYVMHGPCYCGACTEFFRAEIRRLRGELEPMACGHLTARWVKAPHGKFDSSMDCLDCRELEQANRARDGMKNLFWPPANEMDEHIYEIRNGRTVDYVRTHVAELVRPMADERDLAQVKCAEIAQGYRHLGEVAMSCKLQNTPDWMEYLTETIAQADAILDSPNPGQPLLERVKALERVRNYVLEHNDELQNSPGHFSELTTLARDALPKEGK